MCVFLVASIGWGQTVLLNETLRNGSLPANWTQTSVTFTTATSGYANFTTTGALLTSPVFNSSAHASIAIDVSVAKFGSGGDGPITVEYSLNDGVDWTVAGNTSTPTSATYLNNTISIAATSATMRVRFTRASSASQKRVRDVVINGIGSGNVVPTAAPTFSGTLNISENLTASSGYADADGDLEGTTTYKWYRADDVSGTGEAAIVGATSSTYTLTTADEGKYIRVGVVPVAATGTSPGVETFSTRQLVNSRPTASAVSFSGVLNTTQTLTGLYSYADVDIDLEGTSTFKWFRADDVSGTGQTAISGATSSTYVLQAGDVGKYIAFGVTPVAATGSSPGVEVLSTYQGPISVAGTPSLTVTEVLTESNLDGYTATLTLVNDTFIDATLNVANFTLNNAPAGLTIDEVVYIDDNNALISFLFDGDFDSNITNFSITIAAAELTGGSSLTSNDLVINAVTETFTAAGTLAFGNQCQNITSAATSFSFSGTNLKLGNISLAALDGYTYSETELGTYTSTLSFAHAGGNLASKTIWVKFTPNAAADFNGNIIISGVGAPNTNKAVTGTGINTPPTVTTPTSTTIAATTATIGGNITVIGCNTITTRGIYYSSTDGFADGAGTPVSENGAFSTGVFSVSVTDLNPNTTYYYKAFVTSTSGTAYSIQESFTTTQIPATLPYSQDFTVNNDFVFVNGAQTNKWFYGSATGNTGNSIYISNDSGVTNNYNVGNTSVTQVYRDITIPSGATLADFNFDWKANGESGFDYLRVWLVPASFTPNAGTQIVAGTGRIQLEADYNLQTTWQTYTNTTLDLSSFAGNTMRLVFEWQNNDSAGSQTPAAVDNVSLVLSPIFSTTSLSNITLTSADSGGDILEDGGSAIIARGVVFSTTANPTTANTVISNGSGLGSFTSNLTGLLSNTTYYVRAYVTNANNTFYANEISFSTDKIGTPVATDASSTGATSFTANWDAVAGATSYEIDVYTIQAGNNATDLFISEYVEGSSNNKYIEIFNGTGASVELSDYELRLYTNGASSPNNTESLTGTLANGEVLVFRNASAALPGTTGFASSSTINFNGDDALALYKISTSSNVDIFGRIGNDPGAAWTGTGGYSTLNKTLVRKSIITQGITENPTGTGPSAFTTLTTEWDLYDQDDVSDLSTHTFSGGTATTYVLQNENIGNVTSYDVTSLNPNTTYFYVVRAILGTDTSNNSNEITTNTKATPYAVTGGGTYCSGGLGIAVGLADSEIGVNYQLYNGIASVGTSIEGTGEAISFGNQTGAGNYTVVATNSLMVSGNMTSSATITITPNNWTGTTGNWNDTANWSCGVVPTGFNIITILSGTPTLNEDLILESTGNLTINGTGGLIVASNASLTIAGIANFNARPITFKSDATGTAAFGTVTGTVTGASNVTVERYIPGKRGFRFATSAVTTTTTIMDNWQEGVNNSDTANNNPNPGYGTQITGAGGSDSGFDVTTTNAGSIFTFNNATSAWVGVTNTNTNTLTAGVPYRINIRGDRSNDLGSNSPTPTNTTLRATGALSIGTVSAGTFRENEYSYNLIGNPYQAPINMQTTLANGTNVNSIYYYVWDPQINSRGGYVSVELSSNTPNNASSYANKFLQPGQGAFVRTSANTGATSLNFEESYKDVTQNNNAVFRTTNQNDTSLSALKISLYDTNSLSLNLKALDGLVIFFNDLFDNSVDSNDGAKFTNPDEMLSTFNNGSLISIEKRGQPIVTDIIPLRVYQYRGTNYTLVAKGENLSGISAYLQDQFLQTYTEIPQSGTVNYPFTISATNAQTTASDRFRIVYVNPLLSNPDNELVNFNLYPNPSKGGTFTIILPQALENGKVTIFNTLGVKVYSQNLDNTIENTINPNCSFSAGIYYVEIQNGSDKSVKKLIIE